MGYSQSARPTAAVLSQPGHQARVAVSSLVMLEVAVIVDPPPFAIAIPVPAMSAMAENRAGRRLLHRRCHEELREENRHGAD
jgi:hypothetical protein